MPGELVSSPSSVSSFKNATHDVPQPNALVRDDDVKDIEAARQRFSKKKRFLSIPSLHRRRSKHSKQEETPSYEQAEEVPDQDITLNTEDVHPINLSASANPIVTYDESRDHYEWAVVYENQRGAMLFSTPYYSSLSLLPSDPSPFTLPNASKRRSEQPPITLDTYPLPDGNWKWVSRCWMIDMRANLGEVQHDGFEYNWMFRKHHWRSHVGPLSAGGWVRRRRWIRLMVRPAKQPHREHDGGSSDRTGASTPDASSNLSSRNKRNRRSIGSSLPPSVMTGTTDSSELADHWKGMNPDDVWLGDSAEADWDRLRHFMRAFGRDGRKLEVWRLWLGYYHPDYKDQFSDVDLKGKRREKQWTEDEGPLDSELARLEVFAKESVAMAPRDFMIPVLRKYGQKILRSFIYPDSRAQFLKLLALAGLLQEMDIPMGNTVDVMTETDFWSYAQSLSKEANVPNTPPTLRPSVIAHQQREADLLGTKRTSAAL